jgi:hypothetical protein
MKLPIRRLAVALLVTIGLAACGADSSTSALVAGAKDPALVRSAPHAVSAVHGIQRMHPLTGAVTVSAIIGRAGGTLSIPETGAELLVPAGALAADTEISMTARAGKLVAYDFAPHGLVFAKPLVFQQSLSGTNVSLAHLPLLQLGYYDDVSRLSDTGADVSELRDGAVALFNWSFISTIPHFSGYMIAM